MQKSKKIYTHKEIETSLYASIPQSFSAPIFCSHSKVFCTGRLAKQATKRLELDAYTIMSSKVCSWWLRADWVQNRHLTHCKLGHTEL